MSGLDELASAARKLAERLTAISASSSNLHAPTAIRQCSKAPEDLAMVARCYLRLRRERETLFPSDMFADPAWDIMLDLFAAESEGLRISVSSACVASAVPLTTALRWLSRLEQHDLIARAPDPSDARRVYVRLTPSARQNVARWLEASVQQLAVNRS